MSRFILFTILGLLAMGGNAAVVDTVQVATRHLPTPMDVMVVTPENADTTLRYPTVYLLHGHGGNYTNWLSKQPRLLDIADSYGMVIVCPDGRNSWYWDSPKMHMESCIVEDLVPYIDSHYPTLADSTMRAITGLSMGGHGAMWLTMRHPDIWKNAGTISGGVDICKFPANWDMATLIGNYADNPEKWANHSVTPLAEKVGPGRFNIIMDCGVDDFFYEVNENLHRIFLRNKVDHDYISRPGKHNWDYWNNSVLYQMLFFNEAFNKARRK